MSEGNSNLDFAEWVLENMSQEQCERALTNMVTIIHDNEQYPAFLVRPNFVVCYGSTQPNGCKIMQIYRVSPTENPHVYRYEGGVS